MCRTMSKKKASILLCIFMMSFLTIRFLTDSDREFQLDSENLVVAAMYRARNTEDLTSYGLSYMENEGLSSAEQYGVLVSNNKSITPVFTEYKSQIGLQGFLFSFLCKRIPYFSIKMFVYFFRGICSVAMAITVTFICVLLWKKYNLVFSGAFYLTFAFSSWTLNFSPNLYWVSFTWFVPMLLGLWLSLDYTRFNRWWMFLLIFVSVFVKCACGYEYISTIMMGLILSPLVDLITEKKEKRMTVLKIIFKMGITALLAFGVTLCIHALIRGNGDIASGINMIWKEDVLRRTLGGNSSDFPAVCTESLNASIVETLKKYFTFHTEIVANISAQGFKPLIVISTVLLIYRSFRNKNNAWELVFAVVAFFATISWFVLGKSHSYIHTHMNYVLWYFGYIQVCIYSIIILISDLLKIACLETNNQQPKDSSYLLDK